MPSKKVKRDPEEIKAERLANLAKAREKKKELFAQMKAEGKTISRKNAKARKDKESSDDESSSESESEKDEPEAYVLQKATKPKPKTKTKTKKERKASPDPHAKAMVKQMKAQQKSMSSLVEELKALKANPPAPKPEKVDPPAPKVEPPVPTPAQPQPPITINVNSSGATTEKAPAKQPPKAQVDLMDQLRKMKK